MAAIVIADASPLIALARVGLPGRGGLGWLQELFGQMLVSEKVMAELLSGSYPAKEAPIKAAIAAGWLRAVAVNSSAPALIGTGPVKGSRQWAMADNRGCQPRSRR